jgi:hypothetical protein
MATPEIIYSVERIREKIIENMQRYGSVRFSGDINWYIEESSDKGLVVGVDSSYASRIYKYIYLYLIRGVAVPYGENDIVRRCLVSDSDSDAHFIAVPAYETEEMSQPVSPPVRELKKILSHRAKDLEVGLGHRSFECLRELVGEEPLILMDGSARGFLPYRFKETVARRGFPLIEELKKSWEKRINVIKDLSKNNHMVFISKTQTRTYLSHRLGPYIDAGEERISILVPDVILLDLYLTKKNIFRDGVRTPGFSEPIIYLNADPPEHITIFYAVFERGGGMYQVSIVGEKDLDTVREIYRRIKYWSPGGYPEPLREAHHYARLRYSDLEKMLHISGVYVESGREALEI